jgi:hypothetical protein
VALAVRNAVEEFHVKHLIDARMAERNLIIRNAIYTALHAWATMSPPASRSRTAIMIMEETMDVKEMMSLTAVGQCDTCGRKVWHVGFIGGPCMTDLVGYSYDDNERQCTGRYRGINAGVLIELHPNEPTIQFLVHILMLQHRGSTDVVRQHAQTTLRDFSTADAVQLLTHIYQEIIPANAQEMDAARGLLRQAGYAITE